VSLLDVLASHFGPGVRLLKTGPDSLIALEKPSGIRSHPNTGKVDSKALLKLPYDAQQEGYLLPDDQPPLALLHRLDAPTSGVILLAPAGPLAKAIRTLFAQHKVAKTYLALCKGNPRKPKEIWRDRLQVRSGPRGARVTTGSGDPAETAMTVLRRGTGEPLVSLLQLEPKTGRTHQLRVQAAARHLPLLGDATYGDFRLNRRLAQSHRLKRLCLHAHRITLPLDGQNFTAESPAPDIYARFV